VTASAAVVACATGLASAGTAAALLDRLSLEAEDRRLLDAAMVLALKLGEGRHRPGEDADDEAREVSPLGLRIALFDQGRRLGGSPVVPALGAPGCVTLGEGADARRACAAGPGEQRIVVLAHSATPARRQALALAVGLASLVAAALGALASRAAGRWALAPLTHLRAAIARVPTEAPGRADLGPASGAAEVDALRGVVRTLLARLDAELERSRTFAASAAHELRTPLTTMGVELALLAELPAELATSEPIARVRRTLVRLSLLVDRLLALASDAEQTDLRADAVALDDVVRDVLSERGEGDRARLAFAAEGEGPQGMVRGDALLLRAVADNLIDNALKFSGTRPVSVRVDEGKAVVELVVRDEGPGLDPAEAEHLQLPFVRRPGEQAPGHGLAIAAHVARLHGGTLRVIAPGQGTEVRVTLPARNGEP
jgi:two-component system, OmpR family, sensor kinase